MYRHNGGGEMLVYSAFRFRGFPGAAPDVAATMEQELYAVVAAAR